MGHDQPRKSPGLGRASAVRRRTVGKIVSEERIAKAAKRLNSTFDRLRFSFSPPKNDAERRRWEAVLRSAATKTLLGAYVYLTEHRPAVARALLSAGTAYAEAAIAGTNAEFIVRQRVAKRVPDWMIFPWILECHRLIYERLRKEWSAAPSAIEGRPHFVSHKGRYGSAQMQGTRRRYLQRKHRVDVVLEVLDNSIREAQLQKALPSEREVGRWLERHRTPAKLSLQMIGFLTAKSPRLVKKMLNDAGKYMKLAAQQHDLLDLWGFARTTDPKNQSSPAPKP